MKLHLAKDPSAESEKSQLGVRVVLARCGRSVPHYTIVTQDQWYDLLHGFCLQCNRRWAQNGAREIV